MNKRGLKSGVAMRHELDAVPYATHSVVSRLQRIQDLNDFYDMCRKRSLLERFRDWFRQLARSSGTRERTDENRKADDDE